MAGPWGTHARRQAPPAGSTGLPPIPSTPCRAVPETVLVAIRLVRYSRRIYAYMGSDGGAVPWGAFLLMAGAVALGYRLGSLAALASGTDTGEWGKFGFYAAIVLCVLLLLITSGVVLVARLLKIADDDRPDTPQGLGALDEPF